MKIQKGVILIFLFLSLCGDTRFLFSKMMIITHPDTHVTSLKKKDIRDIFLGRKKRLVEVKYNSLSCYGSASYRFADWFEFGVYYMEYYRDRNNKEGAGYDPAYSAYQKDACACLRFDLNPHWTL